MIKEDVMTDLLFATDLDGTIIPRGGRISADALDALTKVLERGVTLVPATGRCLENLPPEILSLPDLRYCITSNGAVLMDLVDNRPLMQSLIPWEQAAQLLRQIRGEGIYSCVYAGNRMYNRTQLPDFMLRPDYLADVFYRNPVEDLPGFIERNHLGAETIFVAVWDPEPREEVRKMLSGIDGIVVTSSSMRNLEINALGTNKGEALAWLARRLGIGRDRIIVAGDNENDLEMLRCGGHTVVPEGSTREALALADDVVASCKEGGVVRFIREELLK